VYVYCTRNHTFNDNRAVRTSIDSDNTGKGGAIYTSAIDSSLPRGQSGVIFRRDS
jgi:hypothetical protein